LALNIQWFIIIILDFTKILDFVTPQGLKDIARNLQARISDLIDQNEELYSESEKLKKRNQELEDQIRILKGEKPVPKFKEAKDLTSAEIKDKKKDKNKQSRAPRRKKII
jgi:FtsZ-binding cell division protein ZapB